ncbi:MAG: glycosyltransferase [Syntrophotaleaceae bacterium]
MDKLLHGPQPNEPLKILFYGQFIPLHGIEYIISTARLLEEQNIEFTIIGKGQEQEKIDNMLTNYPLPKLKWIRWVPYENLSEWIGDADICLGIFGNSQKASQVIPNKVFQVLACGKPLITRDSPAIRELLTPEMPGISLVPPADPDRMAAAILDMREELISIPPEILHKNLIKTLTPKAIGKTLKPALVTLLKNPKGTI